MKVTNQDKINTLKERINGLINQLYDEITAKAMELDEYRLPHNGIS